MKRSISEQSQDSYSTQNKRSKLNDIDGQIDKLENGQGIDLSLSLKEAYNVQNGKQLTVKDVRQMLENDSDGELDYEEALENYNNDWGITLEPFNMKNEKMEGYFNEEGNYVFYKEAFMEDPWLEEIDEQEYDKEELGKILQAHNERSQNLHQRLEDNTNIKELKQKLAEYLLPGEQVLQSLRRLAYDRRDALQLPINQQSQQQVLQEQNQQTQQIEPNQRLHKNRQSIPLQNRQAFYKITDIASQLFSEGVFSIYSIQKEVLLDQNLDQPPKQQYNQVLQQHQVDQEQNGQQHSNQNAQPVSTRFQEIQRVIISQENQSKSYKDSYEMLKKYTDQVSIDDEFLYDDLSQCLYSSKLGRYFDPQDRCFWDASTGDQILIQ